MNVKDRYKKLKVSLPDVADREMVKLGQAFVQALTTVRNNADEKAIEAALRQNNIEGMIEASGVNRFSDLLYGIGMDHTAYVFYNQWQAVFYAGAAAAMSNLTPEQARIISFDSLGDRAVRNIKAAGFKTITEIAESTKAGLRILVSEGLDKNLTLPEQARQIRQLIGLTDAQMIAVSNFRRQLETRQLLGLTPPDERRLNAIEQSMVRRHMREGHFSQQQIDSMVETYYIRLRNMRAEAIARTESLNAVNNGQLELWEQGLDQGVFNDNTERKFWVTARDERVRRTHRAIPAMNPDGVKIRSQFVTPFGLVNGPGDFNVNLINCRCVLVLGQVGDKI